MVMDGIGKRKRFAVLLCANDSDYVKKMYGGYFGVFVRMLSEEGEIWDSYRVVNGEFPDDEELSSYDGFVITGSCNDAHGNDAWICKLVILLNKLNSLNKKVLGICFGHQILCRALGGKVRRAISGWDIGIRTIHLSKSLKMFSSLKIPSLLTVIECHQDEVYELPSKAEVIGWSENTRIEIFKYENHIMGIQGHPEYTLDILLHLIERLVECNFIKDTYGEELKVKIAEAEGQPNREAWKKMCINFLKKI